MNALTDEKREWLISEYQRRLADSRDRDTAKVMFDRMRELIDRRSAEQIARMEAKRGLR